MNNKKVYIKKIQYLIYLVDGTVIDISNQDFIRYIYFYGNIPRDMTETLDFVEFSEYFGLPIKNKILTQREYITIGRYDFFFDMFDRFEIVTTYQEIKNPKIEWLQEDLGFYTYVELLHDTAKRIEENNNGV